MHPKTSSPSFLVVAAVGRRSCRRHGKRVANSQMGFLFFIFFPDMLVYGNAITFENAGTTHKLLEINPGS